MRDWKLGGLWGSKGSSQGLLTGCAACGPWAPAGQDERMGALTRFAARATQRTGVGAGPPVGRVLKMWSFSKTAWLLPIAALAAQPATAAEPAAPAAAKNEAPRSLAPVRAMELKSGAASRAGNYRPRPAIWLLEDEDTRIYMLGTIHILPPGFHWRSPEIERLVGEADELVVETYDDGDDFPAAMAMFLRPDAPPLLERVPEEKRAPLAALIEETMIPASAYDEMQTWAAALMLGLSGLLEAYGAEDPGDAPGVEDGLEADFIAAKKPIGSIENPTDVMRMLNAVPEEDQVALLLTALEEPGEGQDEEALLARDLEENHAWAQGRYKGLDETDGLPASFREALLARRNAAWAEWLEKRLERPGTVLLAVGAAHLTGDDSVQKMLEARGLETKRHD